jgi:SEC-C motif-containing protein
MHEPKPFMSHNSFCLSKSKGITTGERFLGKLCEKSFLSLWSYPGVFRDQGIKGGGHGKEVCDLLVVFDNDVLIFSDKDCAFPDSGNLDRDWSRWFRSAVLKSANQVWGAERWIRQFPNRLFLDRTCTRRFPVELPPIDRVRFHRIVVAHDVARRCRELLGGSGSLCVDSQLKGKMHHEGPPSLAAGGLKSFLKAFPKINYEGAVMPFAIGDIDPDKGFVHVFDDTGLQVAMANRDTISDFVDYLAKREAFLRSGRAIFASGEDDLMACFLQSINDQGEFDFPTPPDKDRLICIPEGEWATLVGSEEWRVLQLANQVSYGWDRLIEFFSQFILDGTSAAFPEHPFSKQELAVRALARENRLNRRNLATALRDFVETPRSDHLAVRIVEPPLVGSPFYVFLTMKRDNFSNYDEYRTTRRATMSAYCSVLKLKYPDAKEVVVIGSEPRGQYEVTSADILMSDVSEFGPEQIANARELQAKTGFLTKLRRPLADKVQQFQNSVNPVPHHSERNLAKARSVRNMSCPCGSGKKYKRCCMVH